jgi:hypothetical protein
MTFLLDNSTKKVIKGKGPIGFGVKEETPFAIS